MKAAQLETMANAILDGKLSVDSAEQMLGGKRVHTPTLGPKVDVGIHGIYKLVPPSTQAHVRVTRSQAAASYTYNKHNLRTVPSDDRHWPGEAPVIAAWQRKRVVKANTPDAQPKQLCELLLIDPMADVDDISLPASSGLSTLPEDDFYSPTKAQRGGIKLDSVRRHARAYGVDTVTGNTEVAATDKYVEELHRWNDAEFMRLRWPVVAFRPTYHDPSGAVRPISGDDYNGYLADPTWVEGQSRLDAELRMPHVRITTDWQRDDDGCILLDDAGERLPQVADEQTVMGAVEWERRRRLQGRQPWMSAKTFGWVNRLDRTEEWMRPSRTSHRDIISAEKRLARQYQAKAARSQLIQLIRELGGDPKAPDVVAWVKATGIGNALDKLRQRQLAAT